jgi:ketol-acid reductoisomerase
MTIAEIKKREGALLDKLICDYGPTKYQDIVWAMEWARYLRGQEEYRHLPMAEMIEKAMLEVVSGQVTSEMILKAINGAPAPAKAEKTDEKKPAAKAADKKEKEAEPKKEKKEKKEKGKKD